MSTTFHAPDAHILSRPRGRCRAARRRFRAAVALGVLAVLAAVAVTARILYAAEQVAGF